MENKDKQKWFKPGIRANGGGCLCCNGTAEVLPITTKLYQGLGGWHIEKNGEMFFIDSRHDIEFDEYYDLAHIEKLIGEDSENEYTAVVYLALRGATYQRHYKNAWVLVEQNNGFA